MSNPQTLIAKWNPGGDPAIEAPSDIRWEDGRTATMQDYIAHLDDTYEIGQDQNGALLRVTYPGVAAKVRFDRATDQWVCQAPGHYEVLEELGPDASDAEIMVALCELPMVYRAEIHRGTID